MIYRFKMAANLTSFISRHFDFGENLKKKEKKDEEEEEEEEEEDLPKGTFQ